MATSHQTTSIKVSTEERDILQRIARQQVRDGLPLRARVILACAEGSSNLDVSRRLNITPQTVGKWRTRFLRDGLLGLAPPRSSRDDGLEELKTQNVVRCIERLAPNREPVTTRRIAAETGLSQSSVSRTLRAIALSPPGRRARLPGESIFPEGQQYTISGLFMGPTGHFLALSARPGAAAVLPEVPAHDTNGSSEGLRHLLERTAARLDLEELGFSDCQRVHPFEVFEHRLKAALPPEGSLHLLVHWPRVSRSHRTENLLSKWRQARVHVVPPGVSWARLVDQWHASLSLNGAATTNGDARAKDDSLFACIDRMIAVRKLGRGSFWWIRGVGSCTDGAEPNAAADSGSVAAS